MNFQYEITVKTIYFKGKRAVCGYEDGSLKIWDLKTTTAIYQFNQHQSSVLCLDCHKGNVVLASGGSDGTVVLINSVSGQVKSLVV